MMMRCSVGLLVAGGVVGFGVQAASGSVVLGQVDTFEADTMDWSNTFGANTSFWSDGGGPGGASDPHMVLQTTGAASGSGSRLGSWNGVQWAGDYIGQGITRIQVDLAGLEGPGAEMRLMFLSNSGAVFTTIESVSVPTDGVWRTYTFDISEAAMVQVGGLPSYADSFIDVSRMHLRHQPGEPAGFNGTPAYDGRIAVDNVRAVPGAPSVLVLGAAGCLTRRRRLGR